MRFSLGLLVGYCMRGKRQLLSTILAITTFIVFVILPAVALTGLAISVQDRRHSRPAQTRVPYIEGLEYETASARLRSSNLKIQVLATRSDLRLEPGIIVNQVPQPGQEVSSGYIVGVTLSAADLRGPSPITFADNQ
ncbi:MAG: PASTA domain-containing protein [Acidobacteriota bacterium]